MTRRRVFKRITAIITAIIIILSSVVISKPEKKVEASGGKLVAFTFDDGPGSYGTTSRLLDGLAARGAKATFFMNGTNGPHGAAANMSLLYRMVADGHQLANHTNSHHVPFSNLSSSQMINEKNAVDNYIYSAMGGWCQTIVRIPGGDTSSRISASIDAPMIRWSVDPLDWQYRNANTVYSNIMSSVGDGSVVLVHDIYDSSVDGALRAISDLQSMGYECVTVSELFRRRGITLENGVTYGSAGVTGVNRPGYSAPVAVKTFDNYANARVKISNPNEWTTLRYTTDGSTPNLGSPVWDESKIVPENVTITVAGFDKFGTRTPVAKITSPKQGYYGTFDAKYYANKYQDLRNAYGYDSEALWNHYLRRGIKEGRQGSAIFCLKDYMEQYPDLVRAFGNDYEKYLMHFSKYGMKEGRSGVKGFELRSYKNRYADLRRAYGYDNQLYYVHYMMFGYKEGRVTSGVADVVDAETVYNGVDYKDVYNYTYYVNKYPDIRKAFGTDDKAVLKHFVQRGMKEGRQGSAEFELNSYKSRHEDLRKAFGNNNEKYYMHYIRNGKKEKRNAVPDTVSKAATVWNGVDYSAVYNYDDYTKMNPDVKKAFGTDDVATLRHFVNNGMKEGRQASSRFNLKSYQNGYADLRRAFGNDNVKYYYHYINSGAREKRKAVGINKMENYETVMDGIDYSKVYDYNYYVSKYPDVKKAYGLDDKAVLQHFVKNGMKEARQGTKTFNMNVYKKNNADVRKAYGNNNISYYLHYIKWGYKENRKSY